MFPFTFRQGVTIKFSKKNNAGVIKNIRAMIEKSFLDEVDTRILLHLQKYVYLNAFLLKTLLSRQMEECTPEFCKNRLKKLEKMGLVVRFQFTYKDDKAVEHATPFVFCLSTAGRKIFPVRNDNSFNNNVVDIDCILRRLSYNQFHIMLEGQYDGALKYSSYVFDLEYDGLYKLQSKDMPVVFYVISVRTSENWEKLYLERLRAFKKHVTTAGLSYSGLIVICENEYHAVNAEKKRQSDKDIAGMDVYYICDYAAVSQGVLLNYVIRVNPEKNYSNYDIISINVDGELKENISDKDNEHITVYTE